MLSYEKREEFSSLFFVDGNINVIIMLLNDVSFTELSPTITPFSGAFYFVKLKEPTIMSVLESYITFHTSFSKS